MSEIIRQWIQRKLGIIIQLSPETFCELTRDGLLLCRILINYEIINQDQLKMIEKSQVREVCLKNFQEHIVYWLKNINIRLTTEDVIDIIDCNGLSSLSLFYRVFLELHEKDCLTFITKNRLSEKFRPEIPKYTVEKVKEKPPATVSYSKYKDHLDNSADVIHWLQDRLEMVVRKCKDARDEYMHKLRSRDRRLSSNLSSSSLKGDVDDNYIPNVSEASIDMTYEELMTEKMNIRKSKKFRPDLQESQKILEKIKQKLKDKAENKVFMKELQKHIMKKFLNELVHEDLKDFNESIVEKVLKQSVYEKQMEHKVREIKYEKQNMLRSKQILNDTVSKENEREFFEKLLDKNELLNKDEFQYYLEKERAMQLHQTIYKEKLRIKAERTFRLCDDAIKGICSMAIRLSEYKKFFDEPPSEKTVNNWRKLINVAEDPEEPKVPVEAVVCTDSKEIEYIVHKEIDKQNKLDKKDFESYIEFEWPWLLQNVTEEQVNEMNNGLNILGHVVHQVLNLKYPLPANPEPPDLPDVSVRVCINGLPDLSCLKIMQKMLTYREILIIQVQDVINFCIDSYKQEYNEESAAEEEEEEEVREEIYTNEQETFSKKGSKRFSAKFKTEVDNEYDYYLVKLSDKCVQTPIFYPEEKKKLSKAAELGKIGFQELTAGNYINDFLMISMFIEYLNSKKDQMKGWVLVNYPTTYEQAVLFEEELSGLEIPGVNVKSKISKSLVDIVYMCDLPKNEQQDYRRCSKLLKNPADSRKSLPYDTILTAFINIQDLGDDTSSEYEIPKQQHEIENCSSLQNFYNDQGCNYSVYYRDFDYFTVKHIAKLIIGDFSIPPKTSVELLGDTIKYLDADKDEDFKSSISFKHSEKREPDRIEKVLKKTLGSPTKGSLGEVEVVSGRKTKVSVSSEDKWTQIPELKIIEVDAQEPPKPGENGWTYENLEISEEIGLILADIWERMEEIYINDLSQVFYQKRVCLNTVMPYVDFAKKFVRKFISKTDQRQLFLRVFQEKFNEFDMDFRRDKEFKAELHCLIYELKNKFMEIADIRMMRAERQRHDLIKENWGPKQLIQLFNNYISGFQIELDRTNDTMSFINDYYTGLITQVPGEAILPKEILPKFNLDYEDLDQEVNKIFLSIDSSELNPLAPKIEDVYRKVLVIVEKYEISAFSSYEKIKGLFITTNNKKIVKTASKGGGILSLFEPSEKIKQNFNYIIESWQSTLKGELTRVKIRLGLLKADLIENLDVIFNPLRNTYHLLYEENRLKYEKEVNSIDIVCRALSLAVENEVPIQEELILTSDDFMVNPQNILLADPCEDNIKPSDGLVFSINQLNALIEIFHDLGPDGYLPERAFTFLLQDMVVNNDKELLPKDWTQLTGPNIGHFIMKMFGPQHFSCWKDFIIYNLLLPFPTAEEIITIRNAFIKIDEKKTELIDFKNFESIKFWFEVDDKLDTVDSIKKLLFRMYQVDENSANYTAMLFDFCKCNTIASGIAKAIAVVSGKLVCWNFLIGEKFINETLEQRRLRDEQERVREIKRRENTKFVTTIVDDLVDRTVHACDSLIITEITDEDKKIEIDETPVIQRKKVESDINVPCVCDFDCLTTIDNVLYEAKKYPFDYFIKFDYIETVMSRTFNWRQRNKENVIFYETLKNIFESCRNPHFNNEVLCHALLNNNDFLELFKTKKFLIIHPLTIMERFLVERQLKEG